MKETGGLIDLHTHGLGPWDTRAGRAGDVLRMARGHGRAGVSAIVPAVYSAPLERMRAAMAAVGDAMKERPAEGAARVLGVHLEGPFLNPVRCGALDKGSFLRPTVSNLARLLEGYEDLVRVITIAPELPGAIRVMERCAAMGIRVNMGHSDATYAQALRGKQAGATGVTHLFNAMRPFHHREPGLAGLGLLDEDLYVEVIGDGVHLAAETLRLVFKVKRPGRVLLVSDSVKGAMYRKGVLQGAKRALPEACSFLKEIGISGSLIHGAAVGNPRRYLGIRGR